jgi:hypothetical protein
VTVPVAPKQRRECRSSTALLQVFGTVQKLLTRDPTVLIDGVVSRLVQWLITTAPASWFAILVLGAHNKNSPEVD